jgi:hypothetical protein
MVVHVKSSVIDAHINNKLCLVVYSLCVLPMCLLMAKTAIKRQTIYVWRMSLLIHTLMINKGCHLFRLYVFHPIAALIEIEIFNIWMCALFATLSVANVDVTLLFIFCIADLLHPLFVVLPSAVLWIPRSSCQSCPFGSPPVDVQFVFL